MFIYNIEKPYYHYYVEGVNSTLKDDEDYFICDTLFKKNLQFSFIIFALLALLSYLFLI